MIFKPATDQSNLQHEPELEGINLASALNRLVSGVVAHIVELILKFTIFYILTVTKFNVNSPVEKDRWHLQSCTGARDPANKILRKLLPRIKATVQTKAKCYGF